MNTHSATRLRIAGCIAALALFTGCQLSGQASNGSSPVSTTTPSMPAAQATLAPTVEQAVQPTAVPVATAPVTTASQPIATPNPASMQNDFASAIRNVAQEVKPAVVQITNEQVTLDQMNQPYTVPAGVGSGVIYDASGLVLTNNHVIEGAQQLTVSLPDGRTFDGKLLGADPQTDLAVVKIEGDNLPVAQLGDSTSLQVGDWVVAIGNALALNGGPTVSTGVVGALGRTVQEPGSTPNSAGPFLFDLVQTDAPINPGNSGGPLVNLAGQVIGINTLVAGQAEAGVPAQGIGFAISINVAHPIADELVQNGSARHPFLGVTMVPMNAPLARQLGVSVHEGVAIVSVGEGTPAAEAGLQSKDVITAIDGTPITDDSSFAQVLNSHKPGDTVTLTVLRGGQQQDLQATLTERPTQ
ncbi:MAG TPA: trypsin-like peptidase domain-containing protein [Roseiflexaceae bacterium]|nr:trypsin-like peptidase domain-containing protein [Roseiflexaceae bacterium]